MEINETLVPTDEEQWVLFYTHPHQLVRERTENRVTALTWWDDSALCCHLHTMCSECSDTWSADYEILGKIARP